VLTKFLLSILRANKVGTVEVVCSGRFELTMLLRVGDVERKQSCCSRSCMLTRLVLSKLRANKVDAVEVAR
jgi:hypothetical protein